MKAQERVEAQKLRAMGWSLKEIAEELGIAKGSVSAWVADIELTEEHLLVLEEKQQRSRAYIIGRAQELSRAAAVRHERFRRQGFVQAETDDRFRVVCALYWGEGRKCQQNKYFAISNADPKMLQIVLRWLFGAGLGDKVSFRVQYYEENGLTENEIKQWWLEQLPELEERHFRKFTKNRLNRASQKKKVGSLPYGTATVQVCSAELFCRVMGGIDYLTQMGA